MTLVLNTRPAEQAAELSALLRQAGFEVLEVPAIGVEPVPYVLAEGSYAWLVLQSQNAARFFLARPAARILCGAATARALNITADLTLDRFSAAAALDALRSQIQPGQRVLVPRAAEGRDELVDGLRALGVVVDAPRCYRTVEQADAFTDLPAVDVVTLCSPSAVRAVVEGFGLQRLADSRVVCLGETTARAARSAGARVDAVAQQTSMPGLVEAVFGALHGVAV
jgi:uroporphyrinogen-III synthase